MKHYKVEYYESITAFEKGLNEMANKGHTLHSWQEEKGFITAVFKLMRTGS